MTQIAHEKSLPADGGALPVSNGRLAMWLFLSTEVMFFAALLGSYLVLRWSTPGGEWPSQHAVHVQPGLGIINTLILIASSLAMARAAGLLRIGASGTCRLWMMVAFLLGLSFLGIKSIEYNEKLKLGLLPAGSASLLHDRADVYYLGHLKATLNQAVGVGTTTATGESTSGDSPAPSAVDAGTTDLKKVVLFGGVNWTEEQLGRETNDARQRELLQQLAESIYPLHSSSQLREQAKAEQVELNSSLEKLREQQAAGTTQLADMQERIALNQKKLAEAADADKPAWSTALEKVQAEAASLTGELTKWKAAEATNSARSDFLKLVAEMPEDTGLDRRLGLNLPKVIPQGRTWANTYFLLTGCHALHLLAGLVVIGGLLLTRLGASKLGWVENTSLYWQFVDVVWLVLMPLIYFL